MYEIILHTQNTVVDGFHIAVCNEKDMMGTLTFPDKHRVGGQSLHDKVIQKPIGGVLEVGADLLELFIRDLTQFWKMKE